MIITKTPLRCSFFGGGTDFREYYKNSKYGYGSVLSTALDMHVYITVNKRFDEKFRIVYSGNELVDTVDQIKHNIIREAIKMVGIDNKTNGIEIIYMADLPMTTKGVGLASSSALAVGVLNALHAYKGEYVSKKQLAKEAIDIEINKLGQQIGIQDQYAVACGGFNKYIFNNDDTVTVTPIIMKEETRNKLFDNLLLFFTGNARDSVEIFKEQKETTKNKKENLDFMIEATNRALRYIENAELNNIGLLLDEVWNVKKQFAKGVSNQMIDDMYDKAKKSGALGGKILGAGGGGFMLLYVEKEKQNDVRSALKDFREIDFKIDMQGTRIIFDD